MSPKVFFKDIFRTLRYSFLNILLFELIYKFLIIIIFNPIINIIIKLFVNLAGYKMLLNTEIFGFLTSTSGIFMIIALLIIGILIVYIEFSSILYLLRRGYEKEKASIFDSINYSFISLKSLKSISSLGFGIYALGIIPYLNFGIKSSLIPNLNIPAFITGEISKYEGLLSIVSTILIIGFLIGIVYLFFKFIYILPTMVFERISFYKSAVKSFKLLKGNYKKVFIVLITSIILYLGIYYLFYLLSNNTNYYIYILSEVILFIIESLMSAYFLCTLFILYMNNTEVSIINREEIANMKTKVNKIASKSATFLNVVVKQIKVISKGTWKLFAPKKVKDKPRWALVLLIIPILVIVYSIYNYYNNPFSGEFMIVGHRGSTKGVENTIDAIKGAYGEGANYAEIDVLLTKDNIPVVIHDNNLFRLAKQSLNVSDLTYGELKNITLKQNDMEGYIPTLDEVCKITKNKINLLIEIKTHGKEKISVVDETMKVVKENKLNNYTLFQTNEMKILEEIKERYKEYKVGFLVSISVGVSATKALENIEADFYVVEESLVSYELISTVHRMGKSVLIWTVNNSDRMKDYIHLRADGIITDYPSLVKNINK